MNIIGHLIEDSLIPQVTEECSALLTLDCGHLLRNQQITVITGERKTGKTLCAAHLVCKALKAGLTVIWVDTQKSRNSASRTQSRILKTIDRKTCDALKFHCLSPIPNIDIEGVIYAVMSSGNVDLLVVDGVEGTVSNMYCTVHCRNQAINLSQIAGWNNIHIICTMLKGAPRDATHYGDELCDIAEAVINVETNDDSTCTCRFVRTKGKTCQAINLKQLHDGTIAEC